MIEKHNIGFLEREHYNVQKVMEIAEEIIDETKFLNVRTLQKIARKRLKLPKIKITEIIELLLSKKILIIRSKYTRKTVLNNPYRRKIYNAIINNNGMIFSLLKKVAFSNQNGSTGQLIWYLEMLIKFNLIKKIKIRNSTFFLPIDVDDNSGKLIFFLKDHINKKIIENLISSEKIKRSDIYKIINEKCTNVYYRVHVLLENNIILFKNNSTKELCISPIIKKLYNKIIKMSKSPRNFKLKNKIKMRGK